MKPFVHIILTRFNVPTEKWDTTKAGKKPLTEEWLEDRFQLFRELCLPSFKNQNNQDFIWLVFFDVNTPERFKNIIRDIHQEFPKFTPVFVQDFEEMKQKTVELASNFCTGETEFIMSAEIDNDDLLHRDYIKISQEMFQPIDDFVLDIRRGYQMSMLGKNKVLVNEYYVVANAFVGIIEKKENFRSILKGNHRFYRDYPNISVYDKTPLFIQTIHGNNLMNAVYETKNIIAPDLSAFGIEHLKIDGRKAVLQNLRHYLKVVIKKIRK